eukprot:2771188-Alexandrium_andersonii.AAC.1
MSADTWGPARRILKPTELPLFSPEEMRASWAPVWAPESPPTALDKWNEYADAVPCFPTSGVLEDSFHSLSSFQMALSSSSGAAGLD